jgi:hypothetical protein
MQISANRAVRSHGWNLTIRMRRLTRLTNRCPKKQIRHKTININLTSETEIGKRNQREVSTWNHNALASLLCEPKGVYDQVQNSGNDVANCSSPVRRLPR